MISTKVIAVVLAVIVVAGGVTAVVVYNNNNNKNDYGDTDLQLASADIKPVLEVYGNVNEDLTIDAKDIEVLNKAITDGKTADYRYADANHDGTVNADDATYIQSIIDATPASPVNIYHLNRANTGDYYAWSKAPVDAVVGTGAGNMFTMYKYLGIESAGSGPLKGIAYYSKIDASLYAEYQSFFNSTYRVGNSAGFFNIEKVTDMITLQGVQAIFTADSMANYLCGSNDSYPNCYTEQGAIEAGLGVYRFAPAATDMSSYLSDLAMMSFVLGRSNDVVTVLEVWCETFFTDLNEKLENHIGKDTKQVRAVASSMATYTKKSDGTIDTYNYVSSPTSDYTDVIKAAGAYFALGDYDFKGSTTSAKMTDLGEWLASYKIDKIVNIRTGSGYSWYAGDVLKDNTAKGKVSSVMQAFEKSEPYYNNQVYVISGDMAVPLRIAYAAHVLYPEIFSAEWAQNYNISHSIIIGISAENVKNGTFAVSMSDVGLSGGSTA
ncbi:MAG: hypothetical protein J5673_00065 [Candidatus Methanomethylophilaceae archaeon]|nr:hypothetical protein [Candidatus Methanomethylophilaceae archaeon]